ncbi:SurA N-terminal domain-containing protein [Edaphobacter sp. HDX4]|uniref:SurA N-terminal domain-containing protein n=1 Tax=Edaphobacter sp. HDX4 TaxID=2794064 RepID=UPI002FE69E4F
MRSMTQNAELTSLGRMILLMLVAASACAQQKAVPPAVPLTKVPGQNRGTEIDGVVAIVNGDVILESDVDEERRFEAIQPYRGSAADYSRDRAVQRLIDRTLILQQAAIEADRMAVSKEEVDKQLETLRRDIPACKQYQCSTDSGWQKYLADNGFTVQEFRDRWQKRMELLRLIEVRFRNGIHISDDEIKDYYEKTMLPEYARQKVAPPKLETISRRIEEVLLQQRVGSLLRDWLQSLRAQGNVWVMKPGEVAP